MDWMNKFMHKWIGKEVERRLRLALAERDAFYERGAAPTPRDRYTYDRQETLRQALEAWRVNPLARRIVELTTQYVVGGGVRLQSDAPGTHAFLQAWWHHPLNQLPARVVEWCDELTRTGDLFLLASTDPAGMTYLRAVPSAEITTIQTAQNDIQQEIAYTQRQDGTPGGEQTWQAYQPEDDPPDASGAYRPVMLHFAINRPVGAVFGESDLAPLLKWLSRYSAWLEDRARLNRFRTAFLYVVKSSYASESERRARQAALNAAPPAPGSILVADASESWEVISPRLEAHEAGEDGQALKKMIAAGSGLPMHFLAEPESATRTTAESAGGPTYRRFEQRQQGFLWMLTEIARLAVRRRSRRDRRVRADAPIHALGADLSARDNASLAVAASTIVGSFIHLRRLGLIDDAELLRVAYRFAGEVVDIERLLADGRCARRLDKADSTYRSGRPAGVQIDYQTGEPGGLAKI